MEKHITCKTEAEYKELMKALEKDGYKWNNRQSLTSDNVYHRYGEDTVVRLYPNKLVTFADRDFYERDCGVKSFIPAKEYIGKNTLVIYRNGNVVTAVNKAAGETGIAKCSPSDEFDFKVGAAIALARLLAKDHNAADNKDVKTEWKKLLGIEDSPAKKYTDADRNFRVGDRVVVREWDDMVKEYGTSKWGDIAKDSHFTSGMKNLCGRTATVTAVKEGLFFKTIDLDFDGKSGTSSYTFNPWMLNSADTPAPEKGKPEAKFKVGDYATLKEGLVTGERYGSLILLKGRMYDNAYHNQMTVVSVEWREDVNTYYYECKGDSQFTFHYSDEMLDKWDESKIHEGDTVKVIREGLSYTTYPQWVGKYISDPDMAARYCFSTPDTSKKYKVIKIAEHEDNGRALAYIEEIDGFCYNSCYLIEVKGLEKV